MGNFVTMGAMLQCNQGMAPCSLIVTVPLRPKCMNMLMATTMDFTPANIPTFGMCRSMANPTVSAATSAAMGVLTPMPCVHGADRYLLLVLATQWCRVNRA